MSPRGDEKLLENFSAEEIAEFIKDSEAKQQSEHCGIYFYGGEPTLVMDDIIKLAQELKDSIKDVELTLHTNGLLLNKVPKSLLADLENIFISINSEKVIEKGRLSDYYLNILGNLNEAKKTFKGTSIARLTIISNSSVYSEVMRSIGAFDLVYWQLENRMTPHPVKDYAAKYLTELSYLISFWWRMVEEGKVFGILPFVNWATQLYGIEPSFKSYPCDVGKDVFLASDGTCFICPEMLGKEAVKCGTVKDGINLDKMKELIKPTERCKACYYFSNCGGRCLRMHREFPKEHMETYCKITKESIKKFAEYAAKHSLESLSEKTREELKKLALRTSLCEKVP
jgi:radical SAM protein with 4Fe4S-binding SPASM domain